MECEEQHGEGAANAIDCVSDDKCGECRGPPFQFLLRLAIAVARGGLRTWICQRLDSLVRHTALVKEAGCRSCSADDNEKDQVAACACRELQGDGGHERVHHDAQ